MQDIIKYLQDIANRMQDNEHFCRITENLHQYITSASSEFRNMFMMFTVF